jgi:hypothetical protein
MPLPPAAESWCAFAKLDGRIPQPSQDRAVEQLVHRAATLRRNLLQPLSQRHGHNCLRCLGCRENLLSMETPDLHRAEIDLVQAALNEQRHVAMPPNPPSEHLIDLVSSRV